MSCIRILVLQSSARIDGNTARVVRMAEADLRTVAKEEEVSVEIESLNLSKADIRMCKGCRSCFDHGEKTCPLKDELLSIKEKMKCADGLILAGPNYVNDVNAIMKNWIDRLAHVCHRPEFAGKSAVLFATTGSTPARHALRTMQVALWTWGYRIVTQAWFPTRSIVPDGVLQERLDKGIRRATRQLIRDIRDLKAGKPSFLSLVVFRIQQAGWRKAPQGSIDFAYWNERGWLDHRKCSYFFAHRANPIKVAVAQLVGSLAAALGT
jgi:multimeric flavodoxin WrbA